jgi:hypothetical protein
MQHSNRKESLAICLLCTYFIIIPSFLYKDNTLTFILLALGACAALMFWRDKDSVVLVVTGGAIGAIAEAVCVHLGVWSYSNPSFLGIPTWLILVWGVAALIIVHANRIVSARLVGPHGHPHKPRDK